MRQGHMVFAGQFRRSERERSHVQVWEFKGHYGGGVVYGFGENGNACWVWSFDAGLSSATCEGQTCS